jgi:hypothetical protein
LLSKELSERITVLVRGPKLRLDFTNTEDCVTLTPEEFQVDATTDAASMTKGKRVVFFARIRVTNTKSRIATKCQGWLVDVEATDGQSGFKPTIFKDSIPLIWSYNAEAETVDMACGVNRYLDLVRICDDSQGFHPQLRSHSGSILSPLRYQHLFNDNRTLRFTVLVSGQDVTPQTIRVIVSRGEQWPPRAQVSS